MATIFNDIFPEYFTLYRGQATNIPKETDPEYKIAIQLANNAVRKWERADGVEWNALWKTYSDDGAEQVNAGVTEYEIADMRKPPKQITIGGNPLAVVPAHQVDLISGNCAWFTGSPSLGWVLHIRYVNEDMAGKTLDFIYLKKATPIKDGRSKIDMSDPTFLIHDMLAARFTNARNGFAVKVHKQEATVALQNMKIEDLSGTAGNSDNLGTGGTRFGVHTHASIL